MELGWEFYVGNKIDWQKCNLFIGIKGENRDNYNIITIKNDLKVKEDMCNKKRNKDVHGNVMY